MNARDLVAWNMRRLRVSPGLSQEHLANAAGVDRTYVSRLERKLEDPSIGVLEKVSAALEVPISEMFAVPDPEEKAPKPSKTGRRPSLSVSR